MAVLGKSCDGVRDVGTSANLRIQQRADERLVLSDELRIRDVIRIRNERRDKLGS